MKFYQINRLSRWNHGNSVVVGLSTTMILGFPFQWMVHSVGVVGSHNSSFLPSWMV